MTGQKTAVPMIADGHYCRVRLAKITQTEKDGKPSTKWEFQTVEPTPSTEGTTINPNFPIFENIPLYDKEGGKGTPGWWKVKIAKNMDALLGTGDVDNKKGKPPRPTFDAGTVANLIGKEAVAKMKVVTGDFDGNNIASLTFPGDISA